jgi:octopine/nopaline transport system permease protein
VLTLSLNTGAYTSEIIRGALASVPVGQVEAARACGMPGGLLFRRVVAPIALRQGLPSYATELILMTKATSLASIVTLKETMFVAAKINNETYRAIEVFLCAGAIYLALNIVLARAIALLEWWLSPHLRRPHDALPGLDTPLELGTA